MSNELLSGWKPVSDSAKVLPLQGGVREGLLRFQITRSWIY